MCDQRDSSGETVGPSQRVWPWSGRGSRAAARVLGMSLVATGWLACGGGASGEQAARSRAERGVGPIVTRADRSRKLGDFDLAIESYRQAFERTPWNDRLKRSLAITYTERAESVRNEGSLQRAEEDLRKALELYPEDAQFRRNLAVVLLERAQRVTDEAQSDALVAELRELDPELEVPAKLVRAGLERRLNLAYELLQRQQFEAGVDRLVRLRADYPDEPEIVRLLAQAKLNQADAFASRENFDRAGELLDEAVSLYKEIEPCDGTRCTRDELKTAHYNRCVLRINSLQDARARQALAEARERGFRFPDLEEALAR